MKNIRESNETREIFGDIDAKETGNITEMDIEDVKDMDVPFGPELTVICKHCGKPIDTVKLIGFSLICPVCGKPQNGQPHLEA